MEFNQNNVSTIVSMIFPFVSALLIRFGITVDQQILTAFLCAVVELCFLIWSARNPNEMAVFGNSEPVTLDDEEDGVLNDEYVTGDEDGC